MNSTWNEAKLGDLYAVPSRNGLTRPKRVRGSGFKMVNMKEIFAHDRIANPPMELVPMTESEIERFGLSERDLLFARQSLTLEGAGKCSIITDVPVITTFESHLIRVRLNQDRIDPLFCYYYFQSPRAKAEVGVYVTQVAAAGIRGSDLKKVPVPLPPLPEQQRIADILGSLDDKIEANRAMNRTLEEMAQALYRQWFVDFGPFQDGAFVDSEIGEIPEGWRVSPVGKAVRVAGGSTPRTKNPGYWEGGEISWTTPKDLSPLESPVLLETSRQITEAGLATISSGLLPVGTVLMSSRAPVGYLAIAEIPVAVNQGYIAIPPSEGMSNLYVLHWLRDNMWRIEAHAGGTTFQEISKRNFRPLPFLVPPVEVLERFDAEARPLHELVVSNLRESRQLAETRDYLLPKLLSGEVEARETVEIAESA